jgi:hypothetical protein
VTKPVDIGMLEIEFREAIWKLVVQMTRRGYSDEEICQALLQAHRNTRHRLTTAMSAERRRSN